jgi:hypothetical protein
VLKLGRPLAIYRHSSPIIVPGYVLPIATLEWKKRMSERQNQDGGSNPISLLTLLTIGSIVNVWPGREDL